MSFSNETSELASNISLTNINETRVDANDTVFTLGILDSVIVVAYLLISISLGLYLSRKHKTAGDYFLAGRSTTWPFIGLSLYASNMSSMILVGLAGDGYKTGISVYTYEWMAAIILGLFAMFSIPTIFRSELYTLPEFLERRYSAVTRYYFSILTIFLNIFADTAAGLYGGALVINMVFPQLQIWHTIAILAVVAGVYTISGGLAAVIYTDALQAVTLLLGSVLISIFTLIEAGGWSKVKQTVPENFLSMVQPASDQTVPWTGLVSGLPLLGIYYWCTNQTIAQRVLSSKSIYHGRLGCILAAFLKLPVLFVMVLPGTMARAIFPDLQNTDLVYPTLMFKLLPVGILGLVLSGFIAALMSQIDSTLNSASTLVTMDFIKKFRPNYSEQKLMNIGRFVTFLFMLASVLWAPILGKFGSIFQYFQRILAYLVPPVVALYIGGFFWKGANARGAILALVLGNVWGIAMFIIIEVMNLFYIHFLHVSAILFVLSFLLMAGVSLTSGKPSTEEQHKVIWSSEQLFEDIKNLKEGPVWKHYMFHLLLLTLVTFLILGFFW
ncbi:sodium/mannose cotransporter SLC5A10-like [Palaemon carinicauda]|uniref:sodium/mannose cotransporter SLC5A10-like n=1 Tax=Palaemon carinicauda TaxID=392227 RepID=UPI0035B6386F